MAHKYKEGDRVKIRPNSCYYSYFINKKYYVVTKFGDSLIVKEDTGGFLSLYNNSDEFIKVQTNNVIGGKVNG